IYIPYEPYGYYVDYIDKDGVTKGFYESNLFKILFVSNLGNRIWMPSDLVNTILNLTPDTIYIPSIDTFTNIDYHYGNVGIYEPGAYTLYFIGYESNVGMGMISRRETTEEATQT